MAAIHEIGERADVSRVRAGGVGARLRTAQRPHGAAVAPAITVLEPESGPLAEGPAPFSQNPLVVLGVERRAPAIPHRLLDGQSGDLAPSLVDEDVPALRVCLEHPYGRESGQRAV